MPISSPGPLPDPEELRRRVARSIHADFPGSEGDPEIEALIDRTIAQVVAEGVDSLVTERTAQMQKNLERAVSGLIEGPSLAGLSPDVKMVRTGQMGAVSQRRPGKPPRYRVLLHHDMSIFARRVAGLLAETLPAQQTGSGISIELSDAAVKQVPAMLEGREEILADFSDLVARYVVSGEVRGGGQGPPLSSARGQVANGSVTGLEYFVLGHEYAHIVFQHHEAEGAIKGLFTLRQNGQEITVGDPEFEALTWSWDQEFLADFFGMNWAVAATAQSEDQHLHITFAGINLYFGIMDIMDRSVALLDVGKEQALQLGSHPPPRIRRQRLWAAVPAMAAEDGRGLAEMTQKLADLQTALLEEMWRRTRETLLEMRYQGHRVAEQWQVVAHENEADLDEFTRETLSLLPRRYPASQKRPWWRRGGRI